MKLLSLAEMVVNDFLGILVIILPVISSYWVSGHVRALYVTIYVIFKAANPKCQQDVVIPRLPIFVGKKIVGLMLS